MDMITIGISFMLCIEQEFLIDPFCILFLQVEAVQEKSGSNQNQKKKPNQNITSYTINVKSWE